MLQWHFIVVISLIFISYKQFTHFSYRIVGYFCGWTTLWKGFSGPQNIFCAFKLHAHSVCSWFIGDPQVYQKRVLVVTPRT